MLPLGLFRSRAFSAGNAASFLLLAALFGAVFFLAQFLQTALGYGPLGAGLRLLPWTATLFLVAPVAGALVDRFGERPSSSGGLALQARRHGLDRARRRAGHGLHRARPAADGRRLRRLDGDARRRRTRSSAPSRRGAIGKAAGVNSTLRELGGVFGIAVAVAVFAAAGGYAAAFSDGFCPR